MGANRPSPKQAVIPCTASDEVKKQINRYADELLAHAHTLGDHGLSQQEFEDLGILRGAVERIRGQQAASMAAKREFIAEVLDHLNDHGKIKDWSFTGSGERHDYEITMKNGRIATCESKGCLDGNNTNIFIRPPNADEFLIWSLCQNPSSDPGHNAWSGIHTRLGVEIIVKKERVDALVIWDMICGSLARPCPKLEADPTRHVKLKSGREVPPPCIYLFPRTIPDPRNNTSPECWTIADLPFVSTLWKTFKGKKSDIIEVGIEVRMNGADVQRQTSLKRSGVEVYKSRWTKIKRAS